MHKKAPRQARRYENHLAAMRIIDCPYALDFAEHSKSLRCERDRNVVLFSDFRRVCDGKDRYQRVRHPITSFRLLKTDC